MNEAAQELLITAIGVVFLLLAIFTVMAVLDMFNPREQVAIANTQKLAAAIEQACVSKRAVTIDFELPQRKTPFSTIVPKEAHFLIRHFGDPNFVVYYESFPPGEGIGWEVYQDFDYRALIVLPDRLDRDTPLAGLSPEDGRVKDFIADYVRAFGATHPDKQLSAVVVNNIVLN
ncbi:hypothetical protein HY480_02255, partial [Candidatus Uhrbacteria bacterium]|nr:hypothetical protein [Candidatus Uhrbacteria bacterium]